MASTAKSSLSRAPEYVAHYSGYKAGEIIGKQIHNALLSAFICKRCAKQEMTRFKTIKNRDAIS